MIVRHHTLAREHVKEAALQQEGASQRVRPALRISSYAAMGPKLLSSLSRRAFVAANPPNECCFADSLPRESLQISQWHSTEFNVDSVIVMFTRTFLGHCAR